MFYTTPTGHPAYNLYGFQTRVTISKHTNGRLLIISEAREHLTKKKKYKWM